MAWYSRILLVMGCALLTGGCVSSELPGEEGLWWNHGGRDFLAPEINHPHGRLKVAVLPFANWTDNPNAGEIVARLAATELYHRDLFQLVEVQAGEPNGTEGSPQGNFLHEEAQGVGRRLKVDGVLTGVVTEFAYQHGLREEPAVGVSMRLVRVEDGAVVWASSHSEIGTGWLRRDSLNLTAQRVLVRMMDALPGRSRQESGAHE